MTELNGRLNPVSSPIEYPDDMVFGLGNCALVALSIVANLDLHHTTEWFRRRQKPRGRWKGATNQDLYSPFLMEHGVWFEHHKINPYDHRRLATFAFQRQNTDIVYMVRTRAHVTVVRSGWICDQVHNRLAFDHWKRNARVLDFWKIIGVDRRV